jgi:hypothetical protein
MRILIACLLAVSASLPVAQTSRELRDRYGEPDIERLTAARDIGLTVEYGSDGLACQVVLERKQPLLHSTQAHNFMSPEVVRELIDEIVPSASRGQEVTTMLESMGCAEERIEEYENVWITHASDVCIPLRPERESTSTVVFKRPACPVSPYAQIHNRELSD